MTTAQKIIKYIAIALAIALIGLIITSITNGINFLINIFDNSNTDKNLEITTFKEEINDLQINLNSSRLEIKIDDEFKIETNNKKITSEVINNKLVIQEKKNTFNNKSTVIIYLPQKNLSSINIKTGAGKVEIDSLIGDYLEFELGAGSCTIDNVIANKRTKIKGGAGKLSINSGSLNDLDLDMGAGKLEVKSSITGKSKLDLGVGSVDVTLLGKKDDYTLEIDKGIGIITIDNEKISNKKYGNGNNLIEIDGGIGSININFKED